MKVAINDHYLVPASLLRHLWEEVLAARQLLMESRLIVYIELIQCDYQLPQGTLGDCLRIKAVVKFPTDAEEHFSDNLIGVKLGPGTYERNVRPRDLIIKTVKDCFDKGVRKHTNILAHIPKIPEDLIVLARS